jgi:hypothetical protein
VRVIAFITEAPANKPGASFYVVTSRAPEHLGLAARGRLTACQQKVARHLHLGV